MSVAALPFPFPAAPESRRLWMAIGLSVAVHTLVLTLHFKFPDASRAMRDKALDIILVNAKSAKRPTDPQALAQANLDGGGNTDENRRARTSLPQTRQQAPGNDLEQTQRRVRELEAQQTKLLAQARSEQRLAPAEGSQEQPQPSAVSGLDLAESARAMARLEGEIAKSVDEYNKRPRKKNIGARAEEYRFAQYIENWRQKIERIGTLNYPEAARGKMYGSLILTIAINADGSLARAPEINRSSGQKVLDDAARRIVQMAAPYAPFPPDIRRDTDILEITRTWHFTQGDQLSAR